MAYCSHCGAKLSEDAAFCSKCGTKTLKGAEANVASPSDEIRDAFNKMSVELEKAFNIASKEIHEAFLTARDNVQKSINKEPVTCSNCGEKNPSYAVYCTKCGKKLKSK